MVLPCTTCMNWIFSGSIPLLDPIADSSSDPQSGWVTNSMLSSEVQSKLEQTITNGSITMDMLSTELREALDPSHTGQVDSDDDRGELIHGWISEEYASISSIISNGDGGYLILDDEEGDGLSLRNYEANGTLISSVFLYAQDEDWNFWTSATDVVKATDGGYLIVGGSDADQIEDKSETGYGLEDYWVAKIDSSGEVAWEKTFGGTSSDAYPKCVQLSGGNFPNWWVRVLHLLAETRRLNPWARLIFGQFVWINPEIFSGMLPLVRKEMTSLEIWSQCLMDQQSLLRL